MIRQAIEHDGRITMDDVGRVLQPEARVARQGRRAAAGDRGRELRARRRPEAPQEVARAAPRRLPRARRARRGSTCPRACCCWACRARGKSLAAKAVAGSWRVPLLRLDFGALYDKFHGETERNLRAALETAGGDVAVRPVAGRDREGPGHRRRLRGRRRLASACWRTLLTWMSERRNRVFLIATANDIAVAAAGTAAQGPLRRDLLRRPARSPRCAREIFRIHLDKRRPRRARSSTWTALAAASDVVLRRGDRAGDRRGFLLGLRRGKCALEARHVLQELQSTRPLAVLRAEEVAALRHWAEGRTVLAD